ncbi:GNAT family N-acetyltransferase [Streptomyces lincolnensis]|uniref:GNAT family N-acetyltransferase n=1 Tax=Streptomyces lincolnensis TaxID=1915 RepID=UPI001E64F064|nr:GNAT family N-acetyltransferase [Streptomyces lincolnensis]MCD7439701.1 GNAT family N-acetyltransferase [Streptomyces lincolnensis]
MTTPGAVIRPATPCDLKAVAEIFTHYVLHTVATFEETPPTVADWERRLDELTGRGLPFLVAESEGAVAGFAYAAPWRPKPAYRYTVEDTIYLAPDATGRGLGAALLGTLVTESARAGMRRMIAVVADTGSDASLALHRRFGFTDAGHLVEVGHKHGRWIDTHLLQRDLG